MNTTGDLTARHGIAAREWVHAVRDINCKIAASLDLRSVLSSILDAVASVTSCQSVAIYLFDPEHQALNFCEGRGDGDDPGPLSLDWIRASIDPGSPCGGVVYESADGNGRQRAAIPILAGNRIIGAFRLDWNQHTNLTEETESWLGVLASQAAVFVDKAIVHDELLEKKRLEEELRIAREVQISLLPASAPTVEGIDIDGINVPSFGIGGDYYDFIPIVDGHLGIVVADVAGKGVPASLIMASFRAYLRAEIRNNYAIRTILAKVNRLLKETLKDDRFVSAFYGVLDLHRRRFTYSNAGHHPAILFRADGRRTYLKTGGIVLGIFENANYAEQFIDLDPGDLLLLYTDGLVEAENAAGEMYGRCRLEDFIQANRSLPASDLCRAVYENATAFTEADHPRDDTTIVVTKILEEN